MFALIEQSSMKYCIGMDIGGSHISAALVDRKGYVLSEKSLYSAPVDPQASPSEIINTIEECLLEAAIHFNDHDADEMMVGISMPGPLDYEKGISEIRGVNKFESLFGVDIKQSLYQRLEAIIGINSISIHFINDAQAFLKGAVVTHDLEGKNVIGITLGTGIGAAFYEKNQILLTGNHIPPHGYIYNTPYLDGIAEDYISTNWLIKQYQNEATDIKSVVQIAALANRGDIYAKSVFEKFGFHLGNILAPFIKSFGADTIAAGGGILNSLPLFENSFQNSLQEQGIEKIDFIVCKDTRETAIKGAVAHACNKLQEPQQNFRNTSQLLMPAKKKSSQHKGYDIYPTNSIASGKIETTLESLVVLIKEKKNIVIEGFVGVDWESFLLELSKTLTGIDSNINFFNIDAALYDKDEILKRTSAFLDSDGKDSIFGKLCTADISEFFDPLLLSRILPEKDCINILYGSGAACANWKAPIVYIDIPKNEIQFRSRAGWIENLGRIKESDPKKQYKRFYFIDWPVLNRHKSFLLPSLTAIIDGQRNSDFTLLNGNDFRNTLNEISQQPFRVRPWFEPGTWGGHWIENNIGGLNKDVPNYAWSFELISSENGILLEDDSNILECSFDWLLFAQSYNILGKASARFGSYFPIRFDFLDTIDGGNLSIQVHPRLSYMKEHFGEPITQDETYYILDTKDDAVVYLGFQDNVDSNVFEEALTISANEKKAINIKKFVQALPSNKHDLFLIPSGTIHGSGINNLVLEISCTPYIYTFKLYDWLRLDLDGKPRPINIEHGMKNIDFSCAGEKIQKNFISHPVLIDKGEDFERWQLPTHEDHLYAIEKYIWNGEKEIQLNQQCQIGMLVEGEGIEIITNKKSVTYAYAETFIIPAATEKYSIRYSGNGKGVLLLSYVKDTFC